MSVKVSATNLEHIILSHIGGKPAGRNHGASGLMMKIAIRPYGPMERALIELRQWNEDRVGVWVDYGIDQDDTEDGPDGAVSGKMRGVNSLAAVIAKWMQ